MVSKNLWLYNIYKVLKAQVWAIVEVVTSTLKLIVLTFMLNKSEGHWLLLETLTTTITLIVNMGAKL
jgi:hypothetical protein